MLDGLIRQLCSFAGLSAVAAFLIGCQTSQTEEFTVEPRFFSAGQFQQIVEESQLPSPVGAHEWSFPTEFGVVPPIPRVGEHVIEMVHFISTQDVKTACSGKKRILIERERLNLARDYAEYRDRSEHARRAADSLDGMNNLYGIYCSAIFYANYSQLRLGVSREGIVDAYEAAGCSIPDGLESYTDIVPYRDILFGADLEANLLEASFGDTLGFLWSDQLACAAEL